MGLTPKFNIVELSRQVNEAKENIKLASLQTLRYVGEDFVSNARQIDTYKDQTGNLRSSIGFIILVDGQIETESFEAAGTGTDKATGKEKAREFAIGLASQYLSGYVLIVVAGMEYAAAVESKGFDVLTSSSFKAEDLLKESFARIKNNG